MLRCALSCVILAHVFVCVVSKSINDNIETLHAIPIADNITQELRIDNAYHDAGSWGNPDRCDSGSYVSGLEIRYNPPGNLDETAINAVKLYCTDFTTGIATNNLTSTSGKQGQWWGYIGCTTDFVTGFRANVLKYQGPFTDDVAVENMEVYCNYGAELIHGIPIHVPKFVDLYDFKEGDWSTFDNCKDGSAVCGIQTRYEDSSLGDETAIADIILYCCDRPS